MMHTTSALASAAPREELFVLVATIAGLDADNDHDDGEELVPVSGHARRCPAGCSGGYLADPRGPSRHNPTGLRECPVCG